MVHEKELLIKTSDRKLLNGILRGDPQKPLVLLVHGFGGQMNDVLQYVSARIFERNGFASLRFNFFSASRNGRKSRDCTLAQNGHDINAVISFAQTELGAVKIFAACHSFGFPSLLSAKPAGLSAVVSWDGSIVTEALIKNLTVLSEEKGYLFRFTYPLFAGEGMIEEAKKTCYEDLFTGYATPTLFTVSKKGQAFFEEEARKMFVLAPKPKDIIFFENARHGYTEEGAVEVLTKKTIKWFRKYC